MTSMFPPSPNPADNPDAAEERDSEESREVDRDAALPRPDSGEAEDPSTEEPSRSGDDAPSW
jgi:hypothetical protein